MTDHKLTPEAWVRTNLQDAVLECRDLTGTRVFVNARMLDVDPVLAELERLTARGDEFKAMVEELSSTIVLLRERAEKAENERDEAIDRRELAESALRIDRQDAEKAERAAAAMREALERIDARNGARDSFDGEIHWQCSDALASDAGKDFLSRAEVRSLLVRAVNTASFATATRTHGGPGAVMDDKRVGALVDEVLRG